MVSIRLLRSIGTNYAQDYVTRFGFDAEKHPPYLTMALGAGAVTPWQQLAAYSIFANGGYRISPFIVSRILDNSGTVVAEIQPALAGDETLRAIDARNAWIMDSMMHDVVRRGTATRAATVLKRSDLAGKTGTTNDYIDAWFCGYQQTIVGVAWIGFDQPRRMGSGETGGAAALPIWIGFMEHALKNVPESWPPAPEGLVTVVASDPGGKPGKELVYKELLPAVPPADEESEGPGQAPAPVQDAKPKPIEKATTEKPVTEKSATDKAAAEKPAADKALPPKPAEKKP
jgi:penicillin-binding protein 1A